MIFCKLSLWLSLWSMQEGFLGSFLKDLVVLVILARLKQGQKVLTGEYSTPALASPKNRSWSYLVRYRSVFLLRSVRWFERTATSYAMLEKSYFRNVGLLKFSSIWC